MMPRHLLIGTLALATAPAWAVNQCKGPDGQTIFQDAPCPGQGITVREDLAIKKAAADEAKAAAQERAAVSNRAQSDRHKDLQREVQKASDDTSAQLARARAACGHDVVEYPAIGMTEATFKNCTVVGLFYRPQSVNETETALGVSRQYVYRDYPGVKYVYVRNGQVSAIQR